MIKNIGILAVAIAAATPALAANGSAADTAKASSATPILPTNDAYSERLRIVRQANRWEGAYLALSAVDAVQTCVAISNGNARELNPLFGKKPSCAKTAALKAVIGGLHYLLFDYARDRDPKAARLGAQISVGVQGAVVGLNMRYVFK